MDWYRVDSDLPRHPALHAFADEIGVSIVAAAGMLTCLWSAVAEHAEDGDLSRVTDQCIARWAMHAGDAEALVAALSSTGWMDRKRQLLGWAKRHAPILNERKRKSRYRLREKDGDGTETGQGRDRDGTETGASTGQSEAPARAFNRTVPKDDDVVSAGQSPDALLSAWNALASRLGLPTAKLTAKRTPSAKARIAEGLLARWPDFAAALEASPFHLGRNDRGWRANFDWLCRPDKWTALLENAPQSHGVQAGASHDDIARAAILEVFGPSQRDAEYRNLPCRLSVSDHGVALAMYSDNTSALLNDDIVATITPLRDTPAALADAARRFLRERVVTYSEAPE